jgi:hypothetical protein
MGMGPHLRIQHVTGYFIGTEQLAKLKLSTGYSRRVGGRRFGRVPCIILLLIYDRLLRKKVKSTRHNIFERDKNTCPCCGPVFDRKDLNPDHVLRRRHRLVISSRLRIRHRQRADKDSHTMVRQCAGVLGVFDGPNTIPDVCVRTGRQQPGQIVQDLRGVGLDLQSFLAGGERFVHLVLLE